MNLPTPSPHDPFRSPANLARGLAAAATRWLGQAGVHGRTIATALVVLPLAVMVGGCSHYQLGTGAAPAFASVFIEPVANKTLLPQAQAVISTRLRETFARDGRVSLTSSAGDAQATLTVVINDYHRDIAAVREDDTGLARKFNVTLGALCTLRDNRSGKTIFENRPVAAVREVFTDSGQLQAEYQTVPLLADALAAKIAHAALDVW